MPTATDAIDTSSVAAFTEDLTANGISREALPAIANANLAAALPGSADCERDSVAVWANGHYYESSRLLLTRQWSDLAAKDKGSIVVAAPSNDAVIVACNPNRTTLEKLSAVADKVWKGADRPLSRSLFKWTGKGWQVLDPTPPP